jgi:hypothetical protein
MKVKRALLWGALVILMAALASCVLPGTATLRLRNTTGYTITKAYFLLQGETTAVDRLYGATIPDGDNHDFFGIPPGTYQITLALDGHADFVAFSSLTFEKNHWMQKDTGAP